MKVQYSVVVVFSATPPSKFAHFFTKMGSDYLWTMLHRYDWTEFWYSSLFKSYGVSNLTVLTKIGSEAVSWPNLDQLKLKLDTLYQQHDMRVHAIVGKQHHLWVVRYQKLTFLLITFDVVSMDSLGHGQIQGYQFCQDEMNCLSAILKFDINCNIFWTLWRIGTKLVGIIDIMSWRYLRSLKTAPPGVQRYDICKKCL